MASFKKGARVRLTGKRDAGKTGVVFWADKSKFDPGMRYGIHGDDGETYWGNEKGLQAEGVAPAPAPKEASGKKPKPASVKARKPAKTRKETPGASAARLAQEIESLAKQTGLDCQLPIYLLERRRKTSGGASYNRVGFRPKGPPEPRAPRGYQPVLSLDLKFIPELQPMFPGVRAICLYVDRPRQGFDGAAVIRLSAEECKIGISGGRNFEATRVLVPAEVFEENPPGSDLDCLRQHICEAPGRALGRPLFLQQEISHDDEMGFVLQADTLFSGLHLGESGKLYLFSDDAFWECL